jgi:hypothetical protein
MEENIKVFGRMENKMVKESFFIKKKMNGEREFGMKERELNGLVKILKNTLNESLNFSI